MCWTQLPVKDFGRVITGKTPPTSSTELFGEVYPFITPTDIDGVHRIITTDRFLSEEGKAYQLSLLLPPKAICVVCIGATIGKVCVTEKESFTNQQINSVIVDESNHDPGFVYYALKQNSADLINIAGGAATPIINKSDFSEVKLPAPPLPVQRRIAEVLGRYDALIENYQRQIGILEASAHMLYREWFMRGRCPLAQTQIDKSSEGEERRLGEIATDTRRIVKAQDLEQSTPYVGLEHLSIKSIVIRDWGTADDVDSDKLAFEKNEILFGKIRPYLHKVCLSPFAGVCSSDAIVIKPTIKNGLSFLLFTVFDEKFIEFADNISNGTKMPRAEWGILKTYKLIVPADNVLAAFETLVFPMLAKMENLQTQITALRQMRNKLLPRLMSGQIPLTTTG